MRPIKNTDSFSIWLRKRIHESEESVYEIADYLHIKPKTIYRHLNGENAPTFPMIVAYCWYFMKGDDPNAVWDLMEEVN